MSLSQALETRYDVDVQPEGWVLPNRAKFVNWLDKNYKYGKPPPKPVCSECENDTCVIKKKSDLFPHQKFIKDYIQFQSPYRGLLLYHGLGSGKSLSSIAAAEILMNHMDVYVLLPNSLEQNYISEIRKFGRKYFALHQHWEKNPNPTTSEIKTLKISEDLVVKHKGLWVPNPDKPSNFSKLSTDQQKQITAQTEDVIQNRYNFIHTDGLQVKGLKKFVENGNPFDNKCVIIDEVHNLISRISNNTRTGKPIYKLLMMAKNCKIILLSGTPVINRPFEFAFIANILRGYMKLYEGKVEKGNVDQLEEYFNKCKYIDIFNVNKTQQSFNFTLLPNAFRWLDKTELEVKRTKFQKDEVVIARIITDLSNIGIKSSEIKVHSAQKKPTKESDKFYRALPEEEDVFNSIYIDSEHNEFKNGEMFVRRILGLVSFYSSYSKDLFPTVNIYDVDISMPNHMFVEYEKEREKERHKERFKPVGLFETSNQVYRFYSRAVCNFVFPKGFKREFPSDLRKAAQELDDPDETASRAANIVSKGDKNDVNREYEANLKKLVANLVASDHLKLENLKELSPKYYEIITRINDLKGTALAYSQFRKVEGIGLLCRSLDKNGYAEFKIKQLENGEWDVDMSEEDMKKPKYFQFYSNHMQTQILLKIFNSDLENIPPLILEKLQAMHPNNYDGDWLKVIMITQSGSEGISLKCVRQVHVIEPFWNHIRMDQVIGRAVRMCSHQAFDDQPERKQVDVFIYYMIFTPQQIEKSFTIRTQDKSLTSDNYLYVIAKRKKKIIDSMLDLLKRAAVDCALNAKHHKHIKNLKCFSFPSNIPEDRASYTMSISQETFDNEFKQEIEEKGWKGQVLVTKSGKYLVRKETGDVYDYEIYQDANKLVPLGKLIVNEDGKRIIKMKRSPKSAANLASSSPNLTNSQKSTSFQGPFNSSKSSSASSKKPSKSSSASSPPAKLPSKHSSSSKKSPKIHLGMLKNTNNSCYMDTFLMAIMHVPSNPIIQSILNAEPAFSGKGNLTIEKNIQSIQDEFKKIYTLIQDGGKKSVCSSLRTQFANFDKAYVVKYKKEYKSDPQIDVEWQTEQNEPYDVAVLLERAFKLPKLMNKTESYQGTSPKTQQVSFSDVLIPVTSDDDDIKIKHYFPIHKDTFYNEIDKKQVTKTIEYSNAQSALITIKRGITKPNFESQHKSLARVECQETIQMTDNNNLDLVSIMVHHGNDVNLGHYTCLIKQKNTWFEYDDLQSDFKHIGSFNQISDYVFQNAVGFVYI